MRGHEIKQTWLTFFKDKGHKIEESASLVPINDPTLLWINAGVAPLKGYFDGSKVPPHPRLVNAQKCIRTNDIENVGQTARHHTFFEMLGNFSIGDYFRNEVIPWAYELLTDAKYYGFDPNKLYYTVYPTDEETKAAWKALGIEDSRIIESYNNFWEIGEGPCGPCTEIFYDRGAAFGEGDTTLIRDDIENDRYIEIWNIVFSQFNAKAGLNREDYPELPSKNIDTGMGLERMACILQNTETNFETDLFYPLIEALETLSKVPYEGQASFKIISDHLRSVVFAVSDGATLSSEGRGYVLRRLLRRAIKHGRSLGIDKPFLKTLVETVVTMMEETYPYLRDQQAFTEQIIEKEELKFLETLAQGEKMVSSLIEKHPNTLPGAEAFMLYDTYGFPVELTEEYAQAYGVSVDKAGFEVAMQEQKERARSARKTTHSMHEQDETLLAFKTSSRFVGYDQLSCESDVIFVHEQGVVTKETPFYAESGGQVSDQGVLIHNDKVYQVDDVIKLPNGQTMHVLGDHDLALGDKITLQVDQTLRDSTLKHHSVTHLLFHTLREDLGAHVSQQGSQVGPESMRFDYNHLELLDDDTILAIEKTTNDKIQANYPVLIYETTLEEAKALGAIAEFGEKYTSTVRLVDMGVTKDLCGGTHVKQTQEIERYAIVSVESKGSGIYRITGLAGDRIGRMKDFLKGQYDSYELLRNKANQRQEEALRLGFKNPLEFPTLPTLKGSYQDVINLRACVHDAQQALKVYDKALADFKAQQATQDLQPLLDQIEDRQLVARTSTLEAKAFKALADRVFDEGNLHTLVLINPLKTGVMLVAKTDGNTHAGKTIKRVTQAFGGSGGGRPDFAQGGIKTEVDLDEVEAEIKAVLS